jgi:hypothetical protein
MHPAAQDQSHPLALVAKFASFAWLFAVIVLLHAAYQSAFWDDLSNAYTARGRYAAFRATVGFRGIPVETLLPRLNSALPITTPVALSELLARDLFTKQRLTELLYPRTINASATYRLEIVNAADFTPDRGLELARTPRQQVFFLSGAPVPETSALIEEELDFSFFAFLGSTLAALGLGLIFARWLRAEGTLFLPALILSGALAIGLISTLTTWLQISVRPLIWNIAGLALCVVTLARRAVKRTRSPALLSGVREALRAPENYALALVLLLFFFTMLEHPITLWDGRSIWLLHAKQLFVNGMLGDADLLNPALQFSQSEYPLLHPAWMAHFSGFASSYNERLAAVGVPVLLSAVVAMVWQLLRRATSRWVGAAITLAAFSSVAHIAGGGYADGLVMFLLLLEFLALQSPDSETLGWLAAAAVSLVKLEGCVFASLIACACLLAVPYLKERSGSRRLAPLLVLAPAFIHILWGRVIGLRGDFDGIDWSGVCEHLFGRLSVIVTTTYSALSVAGYTRSHAIVWEGVVALMFSLVFWLCVRPRRRSAELSIALALAYASVAVALMLVTPRDLAWHVSTAMDRLLLHPALLALVSPFLFLKEA